MIDTSGYKAILRVKEAYLFDIGGFLARVYTYMRTIGTVSMLTLAGYSFVDAGIVSSVVALSMFAASPIISRIIDRRGQARAVAFFTAIALAGLALLIAAVSLKLPLPACLAAAVLMGALPTASALVRTRWVFLLKRLEGTGGAPSLKAVLSYEGVLDDIAFMVGPALSVALAAAVFPACGMLVGGVCCVVGTAMLLRSRDTDPGPQGTEGTAGIQPATPVDGKTDGLRSEAAQPSLHPSVFPSTSSEADTKRDGTSPRTRRHAKPKSVFAENGVVRLLTVIMFILGVFYGVFDTGLLGYAEDIEAPMVSSAVLVLESVASVVAGLVFGMIAFKRSPLWQLVVTAVLFGGAYSTLFLVNSTVTLVVFASAASFAYAPLLITCNVACERTSPTENLTEALTWLTTGSTLGLAVGPTLGGIIIDYAGSLCTFGVSAALALAIPVFTLACIPLFKRYPKILEENR